MGERVPAGQSPTSGRPAAGRREFLVATVGGGGEVELMSGPTESSDPDRLLTGPEVARLLGIEPVSWRSQVSQGYAPAADDPDEGRHVNRRLPRWKLSTIEEYLRGRASASWKRKGAAGGDS